MSNPELDVTVYEDIVHLSSLWSNDKINNSDIRNSSHILRRLLIYNDLQKCANPRRHELIIESPDNKTLIGAARNNALDFFQSGGTVVLGVWFRASTVAKGNGQKLAQLLNDFNPEEKISLNISSFLKQPVFYFREHLINRADVIKYVSNKAGGPHFDLNRANSDKILDYIRSAVSMRMENDIPAFGFDINALSNPSDDFEITRGSIDPVFIEMAAACRYLTESPSVVSLCKMIKDQHGL